MLNPPSPIPPSGLRRILDRRPDAADAAGMERNPAGGLIAPQIVARSHVGPTVRSQHAAADLFGRQGGDQFARFGHGRFPAPAQIRRIGGRVPPAPRRRRRFRGRAPRKIRRLARPVGLAPMKRPRLHRYRGTSRYLWTPGGLPALGSRPRRRPRSFPPRLSGAPPESAGCLLEVPRAPCLQPFRLLPSRPVSMVDDGLQHRFRRGIRQRNLPGFSQEPQAGGGLVRHQLGKLPAGVRRIRRWNLHVHAATISPGPSIGNRRTANKTADPGRVSIRRAHHPRLRSIHLNIGYWTLNIGYWISSLPPCPLSPVPCLLISDLGPLTSDLGPRISDLRPLIPDWPSGGPRHRMPPDLPPWT